MKLKTIALIAASSAMTLPAFAADPLDPKPWDISATDTLFGAEIINKASFSYSIGTGADKKDFNADSNEVKFEVDRKVVFSLTDSHDGDGSLDADAITVSAGDVAITTYTLKNDSNAPISFKLPKPTSEDISYSYSIGGAAAVSLIFGDPDADFILPLETGIQNSAGNDNVVITVSTKIAGDASDGFITSTPFSITAVEPATNPDIGTSGVTADDDIVPTLIDVAWEELDIQTVTIPAFIDESGATAKIFYNLPQKFKVSTAIISLKKSVRIFSDPINGEATATNFPKAIPGAVVEYTLTVINKGSGDASAITLSDTVVSELAVTDTGFIPVYTASGTNINVDDNSDDPANADLTIAGQLLTFSNISVDADTNTADNLVADTLYNSDGRTVITFTVKLK